jgi:hypothetical protein
MQNSTQQEIEKGFAEATVVTQTEKLAHIISVITNPLFIALPLFLAVALKTAPDPAHALLWWAIIAIGLTGAPFLFILIGVQRGYYTDNHISVRSQRLVPLLFGLLCMGIVFLVLFLLHATRPLIVVLIASLISLVFATAITQLLKYKLSLHMIGITGAVTTCWLLFSPVFLLCAPLIILVGWARWKVHAHTFLQACLGAGLALFITLVMVQLFGLL